MDQIDYMTVVQPVQEITLVARGRASPWRELLVAQGFQADSIGHTVEIIMSATKAVYLGSRFREFSVSIRTGERQFFLCHAYNSLRLFALAERRFFRTPYFFANIEVANHRIALRQQGKHIFKAILPTHAQKIGKRQETHEWKIHLPKAFRNAHNSPHYFFARLEGDTTYFTGDCAELEFPHPSPDPIMERLQQSNLQVINWMVRPKARHSKSRTVDAIPE
ncbi:MAG: hypothetical protein KC496_09635 [Anaerolineae bacterium]|nr:hypothetical protein [Anaerolineae bacterium]